MKAIAARLSALFSWANRGWPTIALQFACAMLLVFGVGCVVEIQWSDFLFGPVFAFFSFLAGEERLPTVGWLCVALGGLLFVLTLPAQRRQFARVRKDQAMLKRQDWRK
jgi:hypothetical protein